MSNGNSQAVRLPPELRFEDDEVRVTRLAGGVLLLPKKIAYEQVMSTAARFRGRIHRAQPSLQERKWR